MILNSNNSVFGDFKSEFGLNYFKLVLSCVLWALAFIFCHILMTLEVGTQRRAFLFSDEKQATVNVSRSHVTDKPASMRQLNILRNETEKYQLNPPCCGRVFIIWIMSLSSSSSWRIFMLVVWL